MSGNDRIRVLALTLALLMTLTACASSRREEEPAPGPPPRFQGSLVLAAAPDLPGSMPLLSVGTEWLVQQVGTFEANHPGLRVELKLYNSAVELEQSLLAGGGSPPDLLFGRFLPELTGKYADLRSILGPESLTRFQSGALRTFQRGSSLHGIPLLLEVPVLALNRNTFASVGVPLPSDGRWTRAEFEQVLKQFAAQGRPAVGFCQLQGFYDWLPLAGPLFSADGSPSPEAEGSLRRLQLYRDQGWVNPDSAKLTPEETWQLFADTDAGFAILPVSPWAIPLLREPPFSASLAIASFPDGVTTGRSYGLTFFSQDDPLKLKALADLALFLAQPAPLRTLARRTGLIPADLSAGNPFQDDPVLKDLISHVRGFQPLPSGLVWDRAEGNLARVLHLAAVGGISPAEAAGALSRHLKEAAAPAVR